VRRPALFLACAILLAGCDAPSLGMPDPVSKEGDRINSLWSGFVIASFLVFGLVVGLILYAAIRFRRRNDDVPRQNPYNVPIEVLYTVTPIVVVAVLFGFSVATQLKVTKPSPQGQALVVNVTGFQWGWRFEFPEQGKVVQGAGEVSPPVIEVPVDRPAHFVLRTEDVNHAFWVPQFLEKRDLIQGVLERNEAIRSLAALTERQRAAIVVTELLGYSSEEAGAMLGIRPGTVRTLTSQARAALREQKEAEDV
jgi:cytochrome c oxidase subunit 2